ncbi:hypothetical protein C942_00842 [Photobacterium marinum]|uniref:DUF2726 domain-containing protein n=1 Tax=Photobacterium marinum TaxID=1056511 RepID=L8JAG2_9GAMM|nr:DUF2726 domain-containing protein [Photobacterium marinum]ELR65756.1 hypothetical protein C942_00842 [Photobacterium marinum]
MELLVIVGVFFLLCAVFFIRTVSKKKAVDKAVDVDKDDSYAFEAIGALFTAAERSFYGVLTQSLKDNYVLLGKVRVADIIKPQGNLNRSEWQTAFNQISRKHIDFVICDKDNLSILCAIELNDSSHNKADRAQRDAFLSRALSSANIPFVEFTAKRSYVIRDIQNELHQFLAQQSSQTPSADTKICPCCSSQLVERVSKRGKNQGNTFWGCSAYPKCRYVEES